MRMYDLIKQKRDGFALENSEICALIATYTNGDIPDYQMAAFAMAVYFNGMNAREIACLTEAMADSGQRIDLSRFGTDTCDKHSTGGVGDKTTLIVVPAAAALGAKVAQMAGRGLGHTGGTIDKLECFSGYRAQVEEEEYIRLIDEVGMAVVGQNDTFVPADKKLYALRDVTATVDSIGLIASSIMSKKIAAGSHTITLDVKTGSGAFMQTYEDSVSLAKEMISIGTTCGRNICALITDMDQPLGNAVGNICEVIECIEILRGNVKNDAYEVSCHLAAQMLCQSFGWEWGYALGQVRGVIADGRTMECFKRWIGSHGGDVRLIDDTDRFPKPKYTVSFKAQRDGYIHAMNCERVGMASVLLGAGRQKKEDAIDPAAGLYFHKKVGDHVKTGDVIADVFTCDETRLESALQMLCDAVAISDTVPKKRPLIHCRLTKEDL